jgi:hypothetical protein
VSDIYDGAPWTELDVEDLRAAIEHGLSLEEIASMLCRSGTIHEVRNKARELGLKPKK